MKQGSLFVGVSLTQAIAAIAYASAFPLSQLVGGGLLIACLLLTAPFLAVGYVVGYAFVAVFGTSAAYPFGLFLAVLVQVWCLLAYWNRRGKRSRAATDA